MIYTHEKNSIQILIFLIVTEQDREFYLMKCLIGSKRACDITKSVKPEPKSNFDET